MYAPIKGENKGTGWSTQESEPTDIESGVGEEVKTQWEYESTQKRIRFHSNEIDKGTGYKQSEKLSMKHRHLYIISYII